MIAKPVGRFVKARKPFRCMGSGAVRYNEWHDAPAGPSFVFRAQFQYSGMGFESGDRICVEHAHAMGAEEATS